MPTILDKEKLPEARLRSYIAGTAGNCLEPHLSDGSLIEIDPGAKIRPRNICSLILKRDDGPWSVRVRNGLTSAEAPIESLAMIKVFCGRRRVGDREVVLVLQTNPAHLAIIDIQEIAILHRVLHADYDGELLSLVNSGKPMAPIGNINEVWADAV